MSATNPHCIICNLDLTTRKGFKDKEGWEMVKFCSSKCRKSINPKGKKRRSSR